MAKYVHTLFLHFTQYCIVDVFFSKEPYGISYENQKHTIDRMTNVMARPIVPGKKTLDPFQKGIIITNNALDMLLKYVQRYGMTYIITSRLNQDVLENFFGAIRSKGGLNDHPSPQQFKYRLRKYILGMYENV